MSSLLHQKYHRHNHYTKNVSSDVYPDSSKDPIASYEHPFQGDFILNGTLYSSGGVFNSDNIGIHLESSNVCLSTHGDVHFDKVTRAIDLTATKPLTAAAEYLVASNKRCFTQFNKFDYNIRTWEMVDDIQPLLNNTKPLLVERLDNEYFNKVGDYLGASVEYVVDGTYPLTYEWFKTKRNMSKVHDFQTIEHTKTYPLSYYTDDNARNYIVYYDNKELIPYRNYTISNSSIIFDNSYCICNPVNVRVVSLQPIQYLPLEYNRNKKYISADKTYSISLTPSLQPVTIYHNLNDVSALVVIIVNKTNTKLSVDKFTITNRNSNSFTVTFNGVTESVNIFVEHTTNTGAYCMVVSNSFGSLTCNEFIIPFDEDNIANHRGYDIVTHDDETLGVEYTYLDVTSDYENETSLLITNNDFNYILV